MPSFNLVDESWIPCIMADGKYQDISLEQVLVRAHEICEIFDPSPIITIALHRFLLVVLHSNFSTTSLVDWEKLWQNGRWDENRLKQYFQKYYQNFYLIESEFPFYQDLNLYIQNKNNLCKDEDKVPLAKLARELSATTGAALFDHNFDDSPKCFTFSESARLLLADQYYGLEDGRGYSPSPISFGACVLVKGSNLFETLMFNLNIRNSKNPIPSDIGKDKPFWERTGGGLDSVPDGYISYLTWPHRRILLLSDEREKGIKWVIRAWGPKIDKNWLKNNPDPFIYYRVNKETGFMPVKLQVERALWRDSHALVSLVHRKNDFEPGFVNLLARAGIGQKELHIFGVVAKKSKLDLWRHERLPLPFTYLAEGKENLLGALKDASGLAEDVGRLLGSDIRIPSPLRTLTRMILFPGKEEKELKTPQKKEMEKLIESLSPVRPYWAQLGISFNELLIKLPEDQINGEYGNKVLPWWAKEIRLAALDAFNEATSSFDRTGRMLKAVTLSENEFNYRLFEILKPYLENK